MRTAPINELYVVIILVTLLLKMIYYLQVTKNGLQGGSRPSFLARGSVASNQHREAMETKMDVETVETELEETETELEETELEVMETETVETETVEAELEETGEWERSEETGRRGSAPPHPTAWASASRLAGPLVGSVLMIGSVMGGRRPWTGAAPPHPTSWASASRLAGPLVGSVLMIGSVMGGRRPWTGAAPPHPTAWASVTI